MKDVAVLYDFDLAKTAALAKKLGLPLLQKAKEGTVFLHYTPSGLALECDGQSMTGDFVSLKKRIAQPNLNSEMIVKAAKIKGATQPLRLLDATAGMGTDSFLLAAAGFYVDMYEYDSVIAALLNDALCRAADDAELKPVVDRITLHECDSIQAMQSLGYRPDVILLDPMFPERQKSALVKKKFQLLQQLECPCDAETELLDAAIAAHPRRIIIKRPLKAPFLAERKPSFTMLGKAIRYDGIVFAD